MDGSTKITWLFKVIHARSRSEIHVVLRGHSNSGFFVCLRKSCCIVCRLHTVDEEAAQTLQDTLRRKAPLLPLQAIEHGMKCRQDGVGREVDIKRWQFSLPHCFSK